MEESRAVLLDLWHTLAYLEPAEEEWYMAELVDVMAGVFDRWPASPRGRHPPLHDARKAAQEVQAEAVAAAVLGVSTPLSVQAIHAARRLGRKARPLDMIQALTELVQRTTFRIAPGAIEALRQLQSLQFRLGVVSNTLGEPGESLQRKLEQAGLAQFIEAWAFSDQLPWTKPAPEIFWHCLGMLETSRERAIHVGDSWFDIAGARAAGLRAGVLYTGERNYGAAYGRFLDPHGRGPAEAEFTIARFSELPDLAERLLSG